MAKIHDLAQQGQTKEILDLLEHKSVEIDITDDDGETMLLIAFSEGHLELATLLMNHGADPMVVAHDGTTILHNAVMSGSPDSLQLASQFVTDLNVTDDDGDSPLILAVCAKEYECAKWLIASGCDLNHQSSHGWTALHHACDIGSEKMIKILLDAGASQDLKTAKENTAFELGIHTGHEDILRQVVKADVSTKRYEGYSENAVDLFRQASELDYTEAVKLYDEIINSFPGPAYAYAKRGYAYHKLETYEQAINDFNVAIHKNPKAKNTIWQRGISKWNLGLLKEAIEDLEQYSKLQPGEPEAFYWMGEIAEEMEELEFALECFNSALRIDAGYTRAIESLDRIKEIMNVKESQWAVLPGRGLGPVLFGMKQADIEDVLGVFRGILTMDFDGDICLHYETLGIWLYLDSDDDLRLTIIELSTRTPCHIEGHNLSGLSEIDAKQAFTKIGVEFDACKHDVDEIAWESSSHGVSLYSWEGQVLGMSMNVCYGEDDEPIWAFPY
jgi:tetratricopeptide (TPR) repeat protein